MTRTLRGRITAATVLVAAAGLAVGAWAFTRVTRHALLDQLDGDVRAQAHALVAAVGDATVLDALAAGAPPTRVIQVRRRDGTLLAASAHGIRQSDDLGELEMVARPAQPAPSSRAGWVTGRSDLGTLGTGWHVVRVVRQGTAGEVEAVVAAPLADLERAVRTVRGVAVVSVPLLVGAVGLLVWIALGRLLRPVERLRRQAAAAVDVYPPPRLATGSGGAEIAALMGTLDALLQRSAAGVRRQRRFLADAAHELLGPLTVLRTVLQVARRRNDPRELPEVLDRSLGVQGRLEQLAQQLLSLARAEQDGRLRLADVDLAAVVRAVGTEVGQPAEVSVTTRVPPALHVAGEALGLRQVVDNLVRNAVRHAGAYVDLHLHARADEVVLDVDDDGPGIAEEDRRAVFEPFVRVGAARDRRTGGAGLGLAIVHTVVLRHGGRVEVSDSPRGGARFRVVLPRHAVAITPDRP